MTDPHPSTVVPGTVEWDLGFSPSARIVLRGWPYRPETRTARGVITCPARLPRVDVLSGVGSPTAALTTIDECSRLVRAIVDAERWLLAEQRAQRAQAAGDVLEVPTTGPAEILTPGDRP